MKNSPREDTVKLIKKLAPDVKLLNKNDVTKVVAFDRRNYYSVITEQMGGVCCSDEFANGLCAELNKGGLKMNLDPTGILTDSACFMDDMPEITNISVGYFNEHTGQEIQNITFLEKLAKAVLNVNWEGLPVKRKSCADSH